MLVFKFSKTLIPIQAEIEKALTVFFRSHFELTCSSRTDAGVHALKNFFHFDSEGLPEEEMLQASIYNLNAILPNDIVVKKLYKVTDNLHCRFDAKSREYKYYVYQNKDPFLNGRAFYYPYKLDIQKLQEAATSILNYNDFASFSKKHTQVKTFNCTVFKSEWNIENSQLFIQLKPIVFLRGMVRGLVGTMLKVGTSKISIKDFIQIIENKDSSKVDFSVPPQALFLFDVEY
ncbi:MAG: tRNA pseudouridine synthase A [Ferruginibacter sp.]